MKQVNSFSARRHFFRNNRRAMRPLRPGMTPDGLEDSPEMANHNNGFGYFSGKLFFFVFFVVVVTVFIIQIIHLFIGCK